MASADGWIAHVMSVQRIEADVRRHTGEEDVLTGFQRLHRDRLPLEVADRADALGAEQLEAANVVPDSRKGSPASTHQGQRDRSSS